MEKIRNILSELSIDLLSIAIFKVDGEVLFLANQKIILDDNDLHILAKVLHQQGNNFTESYLPKDISIIIHKISKSKKYLCIKEEYKDYYIIKIFSISNSADFYLDSYKAVLAKISFHINERLNNIIGFQTSTYRIDPGYIVKRPL